MTTPAISILTPVWNGLPYIKETIASVFAQDFQDWELVIGDNCSTDGTSEYLRTLTDPRIRVYRHEKNIGVYKNNRFIYSMAKAPVAIGLCADDYFHPGGLRMVVDEWKNANKDTAFIAFNWKERRNHSKLADFGYNALPKKLSSIDSRLGFFLFGNIPGNFSEVSVRVDLFNATDGYIEYMKFAGDFEFWSRLAKDKNIILSDANVVYIRRHDRVAATYMAANGEFFTDTVAVYERLIDELSPYFDREKLIAYYNIDVSSAHIRQTVKASLQGRAKKSFQVYNSIKSSIRWPTWKRLFICLPFALNEGQRMQVLVRRANQLITEGSAIREKIAQQ